MNSKLMSYEELVERLKVLELLQKGYKKIYRSNKGDMSFRIKMQKKSNELKKEINLLLSAIHHAKEARKLYEYKRLYESEKLRGLCTDNYVEGE